MCFERDVHYGNGKTNQSSAAFDILSSMSITLSYIVHIPKQIADGLDWGVIFKSLLGMFKASI
jgi:hypothetical protein